LADFGHVAKFLYFWSISSSIVVVFEAFLKDFGSPSSLAIVFLSSLLNFLEFGCFLEYFEFLLKILEVFVLTCINPRVFAPPMTGDAALGSPLVFF